MILRVDLSRQAEKFLDHNRIQREEVFRLIELATRKFRGEDVNVDIKKLNGEWSGFHRIRKGKFRIIAEFNFDESSVFVEIVDWRGSAYKK